LVGEFSDYELLGCDTLAVVGGHLLCDATVS